MTVVFVALELTSTSGSDLRGAFQSKESAIKRVRSMASVRRFGGSDFVIERHALGEWDRPVDVAYVTVRDGSVMVRDRELP